MSTRKTVAQKVWPRWVRMRTARRYEVANGMAAGFVIRNPVHTGFWLWAMYGGESQRVWGSAVTLARAKEQIEHRSRKASLKKVKRG